MTTEEKAKAYDEALKRAQKATRAGSDVAMDIVQYIFPGFAESEDEKIRRTLVEYFGPQAQLDFIRGIPIQKIRDWLEKQKEHKPADLSEMMVHKEPYIAPVPTPMVADEQKPWKVGENAYFDPNTEMWFIKEEQKPIPLMNGDADLYFDNWFQQRGQVTSRQCFEEGIKYAQRLQKEQKPEEKPINWTELTWEDINYLEDLMAKVHYEFRNGIGAESFGKEVLEKFREYKEDDSIDEEEQKPTEVDESTKRLNDNWMKQYFDDYKEQKPAEWDEEDETYLQDALWCIEKAEEVAKDENDMGNCWCARRWLKSLPLKLKKENEEWRHYIWTTNLRFDFTALIKYDNTDNYEIVQAGNRPKQEKNGVYILIKDIKPQSHWKPSEHQMTILKAVKDYVGKGSGYWGEGLGSLIDDLEKLM